MKINVQKIARHRNGVGGESFHVVLFEFEDDYNHLRNMVGVVFTQMAHVAVLDVNALAEDQDIETFGDNCWRGDQFERPLRGAIERWELEIQEEKAS